MPHSETPLLILGASARAAAFSAIRAGEPCRSIDAFADADLRAAGVECLAATPFPTGLFRAARQLPRGEWMYTGGVENHPRHVQRLSRRWMLLGNGPQTLNAVRDPWQVAKALQSAQLPSVELAHVHQDLPREDDWLLKGRFSAGGAQVGPCRGRRRFRLNPDRWYLQRFVSGEAAAAVYVGNGTAARWLGSTVQHVSRWGRSKFASHYSGSIGPLPITSSQQALFERLGHTLAQRFALIGLFGVDVIIDASGTPWLIEVNPRYTASMEIVERAVETPLLAWHLAACRAGNLPQVVAANANRWYGKAIVAAPRQRTIDQPTVLGWLARRGTIEAPELADIPRPGTSMRPGQPLLTVFAAGDRREDVEQTLRAKAAEIARQVTAE